MGLLDGRVYQGLSSTFRPDAFADFEYFGEERVQCIRGDANIADCGAAGFSPSEHSEGGRIFKVAAERVAGVLCAGRRDGWKVYVWGGRDDGRDGAAGYIVADRQGEAGDDGGGRDGGVNRELQASGEEVS